MKKIELEIVAISSSITQAHNYTLVLTEANGSRRLPIIIGAAEAQAIVVAIEHMLPTRPLSHDLMKNMMSAFGIDLQEVVINKVKEGIFHSYLVCITDNERVELDSRTSDAVALAVRFGCPIYTFDNILDAVGLTLEDKNRTVQDFSTESAPSPNVNTENADDLSKLSLEELQMMLEEVLENEDYLKAISIRDEINRRK